MRLRLLVICGAIAIPLNSNLIPQIYVSRSQGLSKRGSEIGFISCTSPEPTPAPAPTTGSEQPSA
jgi:hypothetical protein